MSTKILITAGLLVAGLLWAVVSNRRTIAIKLYGPPTVDSVEAYGPLESDLTFDHSVLDRLLSEFVDDAGWVDYESLKDRQGELQTYIETLADAPFDDLGRNEKLALLINGYNAFTLELILEHYPVDSIQDIPTAQRWDDARWKLGGKLLSLSQIEHEQIRPKFKEPRVHFALVCAAIGCPPLRREAYVGSQLEEQLQSQTQYMHQHQTWFQLEPSASAVKLTQLYSWYGNDFEQSAGSVLKFVATCSVPLKREMDSGKNLGIDWLEYDWTLNSLSNRGAR
ncbi:DUF547 domain-containing protein [Aureliella helgolandensis]|uniref:DUF547 domain-containing protein n=1 Tax=Aureliella helgolandensis TaxID=2527968 RepID=A0A518G4B5_9BACT|nr:DUF547 domain-containing protein [Aureliella helgolandensis]QDV23389.1 hypothetical protein Q31a_16870 [Aureliella helgolandensis]